MKRRTRLLQITILVLAPLIFYGCNDDDCPVCPDGNPNATIDNIWPHEDGNSWTYDLHNSFVAESGLVLYENLEDVPMIPINLDSLYAKLQRPLDPDSTNVGIYRLAFDGMVTTESGVTAQNLVQTVFADTNPGHLTSDVAKNSDAHTNFLLRVMQLRPDLRDEIAARLRTKGVAASEWDKHQSIQLDPLFFLGGYAWEQNEDAIIGYGDIDTRESWRYLDADLSLGHSFVIQLVPGLSDGIFLHGKIMSRPTVTVGGQTIENCVECFYAIDFGVSSPTDESGNILGYAIPEDYGTVTYAPDIGPIQGRERLSFPTTIFNPEAPGTIERGASFIGFVPGEISQ